MESLSIRSNSIHFDANRIISIQFHSIRCNFIQWVCFPYRQRQVNRSSLSCLAVRRRCSPASSLSSLDVRKRCSLPHHCLVWTSGNDDFLLHPCLVCTSRKDAPPPSLDHFWMSDEDGKPPKPFWLKPNGPKLLVQISGAQSTVLARHAVKRKGKSHRKCFSKCCGACNKCLTSRCPCSRRCFRACPRRWRCALASLWWMAMKPKMAFKLPLRSPVLGDDNGHAPETLDIGASEHDAGCDAGWVDHAD